jgi:hypothetical protein
MATDGTDDIGATSQPHRPGRVSAVDARERVKDRHGMPDADPAPRGRVVAEAEGPLFALRSRTERTPH